MRKIVDIKIMCGGKQSYFLKFSSVDICDGKYFIDKCITYYEIKTYTNIDIVIPDGCTMYNHVVFETIKEAQDFVDKLMPQIVLNKLSIGGTK